MNLQFRISNFLYFSTLAWDEAGGAHNPTQLARALARRGHRVTFVEPQLSATRNSESLPIQIVALTELGMTPTQLRRAWFGLDSGDLDGVARNLLARANASTNDSRVAIFSAPFEVYVRLIPVLRAARYAVVYYAMDDFAAAPALGYTQFLGGAEEYLTQNSDARIGVSPHVARTLERFGEAARIVPNGIDPAGFRNDSARVALERGELTLGFWGTIMESLFDAELIAHVAQARPQWTIHLLGAVDPEPHRPPIAARLKDVPNVFLHGAVPHQALPGYAANFDVMLAPFPDNDFTRGRDPIKVYEYLAAHKPVVAAYAPQLGELPSVRVACSPEQFVRAIEDAAREPPDPHALDKFLAQESWSARADELLDILNALPESAAGAEERILPSWGRQDAAAWARYAAALERELEQTQAWARELETQVLAQAQRIDNFPVTRLWRRMRVRRSQTGTNVRND